MLASPEAQGRYCRAVPACGCQPASRCPAEVAACSQARRQTLHHSSTHCWVLHSAPAWALPAAHPSRQRSATDTASTAPCRASANFLYFYWSSPPRSAVLGFWLSCTCCLIYTNAATSSLSYHLQFRHPHSKELIQQG